MARPSSAEGVIPCSISISTYSLRVGTYTASNNALCRRGSGHARIELHCYIITEVADSNSSYLLLCMYVQWQAWRRCLQEMLTVTQPL